jgi:hypothetical protein
VRRRLPTILIAIAAVVMLLGGLAVWVARQALDTDEWVDTSTALVRDPDIQAATAAYLADQLTGDPSIQARIEERLPDQLAGLAGVAAGAVGEAAERVAKRALESGAFQTLWAETNRRAHEQLVDLVEGDQDLAVVFDLRPMLGQVASRIGLGADVVDNLPDDKGRITVVRGDNLETIRTVGRVLRAVAIVLVLLAIALQVGALYLEREDRRRLLIRWGLSLVLVGLTLLVVRRVAGAHIVEALTTGGAAEPAASATWEIGTALLREIALGIVAVGIALVSCAWLAGQGARATKVRAWLAPTLREQPGIAYGVALTALVLLLAVGVLPGGSRIILVLIYGALVVVGVAALRRQVEAEGAPPPAVATPPA